MTSDGKGNEEVVSVYGVPPLVGAIEECKRLKMLLDALTLENAELIRERDQVMSRRAALSEKYEELRVKYQKLRMKQGD